MKNKENTMKKTLLLLLFLTGSFVLLSEEKLLLGIYPDMREFKLTPPSGFHPLSLQDLMKIDMERIRRLKTLRPLPADRETLLRIAEFYSRDPAGQDSWRKQNSIHVLRWINSWTLPPNVVPAYQLRWLGIEAMLDTYFFTGNPTAGQFIHDYTMHAMTLDRWFWMGQMVRVWNRDPRKRRYADLHSLPFARCLNAILVRCRDLFSAEEIARIESRYREYVLESCYEDLIRRRKWDAEPNNWTAILSGALLLSARYFQDEPKAEFALRTLNSYFRTCFEEDGSYGEGAGYAGYAMSVLSSIYPYLSPKERGEFFRTSPLRNTAKWMLYHDLRNPQKFYRVSFGDDNYFSLPPTGTMYILSLAFEDPVAAYLGSRSPWRKPWWNWDVNSLLAGRRKDPPVADPATCHLPLTARFANGQIFIRGGWKEKDPVFCCYTAVKNRVNSHKRPESGNFVFASGGVPLVMASGNTNLYRRPIHQLSIRTSAANTVTVEDSDQLPARKQKTSCPEFRETAEMVLVRLDLRGAYSQPLKMMVRTFAWLKKDQVLVVLDQAEAAREEFAFHARLHLNDIFHNTVLEKRAENLLFYRHPDASLWIQTGGNAQVSRGYVVSERFSIWNEALQQQEADRGNAHTITYGSAGKVRSALFYAVLGKTRARIRAEKGCLRVNGVSIPFYRAGSSPEESSRP